MSTDTPTPALERMGKMEELIGDVDALIDYYETRADIDDNELPNFAMRSKWTLEKVSAALRSLADMRGALEDLADAVTKEVNAPDHRGGSGFLLARLADARTALISAESRIQELERELAEARQAAQVSDLFHGINGHDIADAEKHADHIIKQMLWGMRVDDSNKGQVREYLVAHFKALCARAETARATALESVDIDNGVRAFKLASDSRDHMASRIQSLERELAEARVDGHKALDIVEARALREENRANTLSARVETARAEAIKHLADNVDDGMVYQAVMAWDGNVPFNVAMRNSISAALRAATGDKEHG